jgi:hypothetical protein
MAMMIRVIGMNGSVAVKRASASWREPRRLSTAGRAEGERHTSLSHGAAGGYDARWLSRQSIR